MKYLAFLLHLVFLLTAAQLHGQEWPTDGWTNVAPADVGMAEDDLIEARDYAVSLGGGAGYIVRHGNLVMSWGSSTYRYDLKSTTKSIGATALGLAIGDGLLALSDVAQIHHPSFATPPGSNGDTGWPDDITLLNLATHTAGFEITGGYGDLVFAPGSGWLYSDGGTNWLAEIVTLSFAQDLRTVLLQRVFGPLGLTTDDFYWRDNVYRPDAIQGIKNREFGSGIQANVDFLARIGYLYLRNGEWDGLQIIPAAFVEAARRPVPEFVDVPSSDPIFSEGPQHYGLLWWNNADGAMSGVPLDTYTSWGLDESFIIVIPSLDIVVSRAGERWRDDTEQDHFFPVLEPFLQAIVNSVIDTPVEPPSVPQQDSLTLSQNQPNPFNGQTTISFDNPRSQFLTLDVYDIRGRLIETLLSDRVSAGRHTITFRTDGLASGRYLYRLTSPDDSRTRTMQLVK